MMMAKIIVLGVMLIIISIAQNVCADLPVRPPRPDSFKTDADVKEYMQKLKAFLDKGANRYGKRNTYPIVDLQGVEPNNEEIVDPPLYKEYVEPSMQHSQQHYYPEWLKQVISRPSKRMWY